MNVRRGDIVKVDLGDEQDADTQGSERWKPRPAVVIQNDVGNRNANTTIIAPITSGFTNYPFHVNLPSQTPGLTKDSHAELEQIRTVDIDARIIEQLGRVPPDAMAAIDDAIRVSLGLN